MSKLMDTAKGMVIGVANVIPGVSGGTMAVSLGIYDRMITALADLPRQWKKSAATLLPILLGMALGIVAFTYAVEFLLREYPLATCLAFIGLILGGIPLIWRSYKGSLGTRGRAGRPRPAHGLVFLVFFAFSALLPMLQAGEGPGGLQGGPADYFLLFALGVLASATMVVPGVSGSMVLMILGHYYTVINLLTGFFEEVRQLQAAAALQAAVPLVFFGVGILLGIFLVAKCIRLLLDRLAAFTYSGILGLVAAAPVAILHQTGALADFSWATSGVQAAAGTAVMVLFFFASTRMSGGGKRKA